MTKQDYEALAQLIKVQRRAANSLRTADEAVESALDELARDMAQYLASQNPRFDQPLFLEAAGVT